MNEDIKIEEDEKITKSSKDNKPYKDPFKRDTILSLCLVPICILARYFSVVQKYGLDKLFFAFGGFFVVAALRTYGLHLRFKNYKDTHPGDYYDARKFMQDDVRNSDRSRLR